MAKTRKAINHQVLRNQDRVINAFWRGEARTSPTADGITRLDKIAFIFEKCGIDDNPAWSRAQRIEAAALAARAKGYLASNPNKLQRAPFVQKKMPVIRHSVGPEFYDTWAWKQARFEALKAHGRQCLCCGWVPGASEGNWLVVDHIKPLALFPELALDQSNLQVLCNDCNMGKGRMYRDDFRG